MANPRKFYRAELFILFADALSYRIEITFPSATSAYNFRQRLYAFRSWINKNSKYERYRDSIARIEIKMKTMSFGAAAVITMRAKCQKQSQPQSLLQSTPPSIQARGSVSQR